jgi:ADP-ribosylglycohydrolase
MWGAIIGDIIGSTFKLNNHRSVFFEFFRSDAFFSDDTITTVAVAEFLNHIHYSKNNVSAEGIANGLRAWAKKYPNRPYSEKFFYWVKHEEEKAYESNGNGSVMRISPLAYFAYKKQIALKEALEVNSIITPVTHNHEDSIKATSALIEYIYTILTLNSDYTQFANETKTEEELNHYLENLNILKNDLIETISSKYDFVLDKPIEQLQVEVEYDVTALGTMKFAFTALKESQNFDDAIQKIVSIGGDSDTYACVVGAMAEATYYPQLDKFIVQPLILSQDEHLKTVEFSNVVKEYYDHYIKYITAVKTKYLYHEKDNDIINNINRLYEIMPNDDELVFSLRNRAYLQDIKSDKEPIIFKSFYEQTKDELPIEQIQINLEDEINRNDDA